VRVGLEADDALVAAHPANIRWLTGLAAPGHVHYGNTPLLAVAGPSSRVQVVAATADLAWLSEEWELSDIESYGRFIYFGDGAMLSRTDSRDIGEALSAALDGAGCGETVRLDAAVPWKRVAELSEAVAPRRIVPALDAFVQARQVKDGGELELLRKANRFAEESLGAALATLRAGITERDLLHAFQVRLMELGAQPRLGSVGFRARGALVDTWPSDQQLHPGDWMRFDLGCEYQGYHADFSRTAVFGTPPGWLEDTFQAVLAGERAGLVAMRPGARASDVFQAAVDEVRQAGVPRYDRSHCGHGIGLEIYEPPLLAATDATRLAEGMTLCIETPYYEVGHAGVQVEDAVVVTENGYERLGTLAPDLIVVDP
jgi:Xaa-Pro dipeptidase